MARWICKVTRYKGQTRITLPKSLVESLKWGNAEILELRRLPGYRVTMSRFPYGKEKGFKGSKSASEHD